MTHRFKVSLIALGAVALLATAVLYALFHGYFDQGQFEIKRFEWSSSNQVAMVVERIDPNEALGGLDYYVLIGNHLYTPTELRHAYYSEAVVFSALSNDCLRVRWDRPDRLVIKCEGSIVDANHINSQRQRIGDIAISYENIATK